MRGGQPEGLTRRAGRRRDVRGAMRWPLFGALVLVVLVQLLLTASAWSQSITATVDRSTTTVDRPIQLTIEISGAPGQRPRLPDLSPFRVQAGPVGQQVQVVNGKMSASVSYTYYLAAREPGSYEIGPATVEVDGKAYQSKSFRVRVGAAGQRPPADRAAPRDTFLTVTVSDETPYVGEQVVYTWRFYRRVQVADAQLEEMSFGDLVAEDLGDVREYQTAVDGVQYLVNEIRKALFPQRPGEAVLPPSVLSFRVATRARSRRSSFFDFGRVAMEPRTLRSKALRLDVQALPAAPAGYSGLVGSFRLETKLGKSKVSVGESTTLSVTVSGEGNVQMIPAPDLPDLSGFKTYDDKPTTSLERGAGGLSGRRVFRTALVPLAPGEVKIDPVRLVFFDPDDGRYVTRSSGALALDVAPGSGGEDLNLTEAFASNVGKVAVKILADDVLPLKRGVGAMREPVLERWRPTLAAFGLTVPPLGFVAFLFWFRRSQRYLRDGGLRRRESALRNARARLRELEGDTDDGTLVSDVSTCLRTYVGDRLGSVGGALTAGEMESLLLEAGVEEATVRRSREFVERLEALQFGAGAAAAAGDRGALLRTLDSLVQAIDGETRKGAGGR